MVALDVFAVAFAVAWLLRLSLGAWSWPFPMLLHGWTIAGPLFVAGAIVAVLRRRIAAGALHVLLLAPWIVQHVPRLARERVDSGADLSLVTLNTGVRRTAPEELARWVLESRADVVFLQEVGDVQAAELEQTCASEYPWRLLHGMGLRGMGVLSRHPLADVREIALPDETLALVGTVELGGQRVAFADVHLSGWVALLGPWGDGDESLDLVLRELAGAETAVLAGDFNQTSESPLLDRVRAAGFTDVFDSCGRGLGLSFPVFRRYRGIPLPPVVRIDHVFVRGALLAVDAFTLPGAGSDHRALQARCLRAASE